MGVSDKETGFSGPADDELVRLATSGRDTPAGRRAATELLARYRRPVYIWCYRYTGDHDRALDLSQDVLMSAWQKLETLAGRSKFSSWMYTVATRVFISETRRVRPGWLFSDEDAVARAGGPEEDPDSGMRDQLVRRSVLALPEKYRDAVTLFYFHEQDVEEAATSLGIASGTLKSRLHRGRAMLEKKLARKLDRVAAPGRA